jgi:Mg2+/Co2+ transporter CorB
MPNTITIPFWARILLLVVKFLPIPIWIKTIIELLIQIIEAIPGREERLKARKELVSLVQHAKATGDSQPLADFSKKMCGGIVGCGGGQVTDESLPRRFK